MDFHFESAPEHEDLFVGEIRWNGDGRPGNALVLEEKPEFARRCVECAAVACDAFLARVGLDPAEVELLVASQYPPNFANDLARSIGISESRVARAAGRFRGAHTAGPIAALGAAMEGGRFHAASRTLFALVGSGISVALALYRSEH